MAVLAVGMAILFGIITDYAAFRPVRAKSVTAVLITSFAFSNLLQNAALLFISPRPRNVPLPDIFSQTVSIAGAITPVRNLITIAASIALLAGVAFLMRRTTLGIAMRAVANDQPAAMAVGINVRFVFALSWALAAFAGGLAGIVYSSNVRLEPSLDVLGLRAFAVALVGGLDSLAGVIPAAILVAAVEVVSIRYGNPLFSDVSPFLCLLVMLLIRPWGLFGTKEELERV